MVITLLAESHKGLELEGSNVRAVVDDVGGYHPIPHPIRNPKPILGKRPPTLQLDVVPNLLDSRIPEQTQGSVYRRTSPWESECAFTIEANGTANDPCLQAVRLEHIGFVIEGNRLWFLS